MKQPCLTALLFLFAGAALGQEVLLPEDSMREAWSEERKQFDSLSREPAYGYDSELGTGRDASRYGGSRTGQWDTPGNEVELDRGNDIELSDQPELDGR